MAGKSIYTSAMLPREAEETAMAGILSASFFPSNSYLRRLLSFGGTSDDNSAQTTGRISSFSFFSSNSLLRRPWSFDSSNEQNQTTAESNLQYSSPRHEENPIPRAMEACSPAAAEPKQDSKRVRKLALAVSLSVAALCCGIYSSTPPTVQMTPHPPLFYDSLIAFVSLGVFASLGLLMYSLVIAQGAEFAWFQKKVVAIAIFLFLIAFVLRIALLLPVSSFDQYVWQVFFFVAAVIAVYLYAAWKKDHHNQTARDSDNLLPISVHPTDGGGN